jgi:hypothetical protein
MRLRVPPCTLHGRADELGANIALAEALLVHAVKPYRSGKNNFLKARCSADPNRTGFTATTLSLKQLFTSSSWGRLLIVSQAAGFAALITTLAGYIGTRGLVLEGVPMRSFVLT